MHVVHPICCGLDVHPAAVVACLRRVGDDGQMRLERREYGTTHSALLTLGEWLLAKHCPVVAMESTGVYTPPGILPKGYWSGNMALRLSVSAFSGIRKSSVTPRLPAPYHPTKAPVRRVQEYRMAKPLSGRVPAGCG
jgi:hypothetical protein